MRNAIRGLLRALSKRRKMIALIVLPVVLLAVNVPPAIAFVKQMQHQMLIDSPEYKSVYGRWDVIELPEDLQVNAIHAALLPTGKLLLIAGSGNEQKQFDAGTFRTLVYDPATGQSTLVPTPADMFCAGHAFLPDGKLLVAGGTQRYELLPPAVKFAAGAMTVSNENPDKGHEFVKGTEFVSPDGRKYKSTHAFTVPPAAKVPVNPRRPNGPVTVQASQTTAFVESETEGPSGVTDVPAQYSITGLEGLDTNNLYGIAQKLNLDKQDFQGIADSYEFDPVTEQYVKVGDMKHKRWYPSLLGLPDGQVLSVSGLDGVGQILPGQNELYDPATKVWTERKDLEQYFPTYPAIYQTAKPGQLFYTGSNAGYGPADKGREPAFWNLDKNVLTPVPGLRDPDLMETSGSGFVGPVQDQKMIVVGGGGVGESPRSTARIDVIDLKDREAEVHPRPGPAGAHALPQRRAAARRLRADLQRLAGLPRQARQLEPAGEHLPPGHQHPHPRSGPDGRPRLPLLGHPAAERPGHDRRRERAVPGPRGPQARDVREAAGDLHPGVHVQDPATDDR